MCDTERNRDLTKKRWHSFWEYNEKLLTDAYIHKISAKKENS